VLALLFAGSAAMKLLLLLASGFFGVFFSGSQIEDELAFCADEVGRDVRFCEFEGS
jgi:hypothetical protein